MVKNPKNRFSKLHYVLVIIIASLNTIRLNILNSLQSLMAVVNPFLYILFCPGYRTITNLY